MAFAIPKVSYQSMMKEGTRNYQGLEEAVYRNIEACKQLAAITRTSYGPNSMKKIVINHLDKLFVTKDAATILKELEVEHPAAKIIAMASKMAEQEVGDGTNFVIQFASELMVGAAELLNFGVPPCDIIDSYNSILNKAIEILGAHICEEIVDVRDEQKVLPLIKTAIFTKETMYADHISNLIVRACKSSKPAFSKKFDVDNVRIVKGSSGDRSEVIQGLAVQTNVKGTVSEVRDAKIVVFNTDFDLTNPETKGTVLMNTANDLLNFSSGEEGILKKSIKDLHEMGVNVVVCSGKVSDEALDYSNRLNIFVVQIGSKFELQRLCRATSSTPLPLFMMPKVEQLGHCKHVHVKEIGDSNVVLFSQESEESSVSTLIIRGSSDSILDDIERSVNDGVNCYKSLSIEPKVLPGAGAIEMALCVDLEKLAGDFIGYDKLALSKFCESLKNIVRIIAQNNGMKTGEVVSKMYSEHLNGSKTSGLDVDSSASTCDVVTKGILEPFFVKKRCLQLAVDAVSTLLSVDQIIVARPAGGPAVPKQNPAWDQD